MASLSSLGERELIRRISRLVGGSRSVVKGIGDDCAVLKGPPGKFRLFASDMLVQGVHFTGKEEPAAIGWKALGVNVSDTAAMGGRPTHAVVSLGLPPKTKLSFIDGLYRGMNRCAATFNCVIVGGDTSRAPQVVIDVAVLGEVERDRVVYRSGARPGDQLFVTGRLGGSLKSGRHLRFTPRVKEAGLIGKRFTLHAMMDLSDGLKMDLDRMCEASGVSATIDGGEVPLNRGCTLAQGLTDGEDFELLIAIPMKQAAAFSAWGRAHLRCGLWWIGEVTRRRPGPRVMLSDHGGTLHPLPGKEFSHF